MRVRRHVDKHERPYVCCRPECSHLSGFTYAGGLSRHEREVHMVRQGKTVKVFVCPARGCRRAFARRSNRRGHVSRAHPHLKDVGDDGGDAIQVPRESLDNLGGSRCFPRLRVIKEKLSCSDAGRSESSDGASDDVAVAGPCDSAVGDVGSVERRLDALQSKVEDLAGVVTELVSALRGDGLTATVIDGTDGVDQVR